MRSFLHRKSAPSPAVEPVASGFPVLRDGKIAAAFGGQRAGGDFYDSIRVSPSRVLFGLLDVAGRREDNEEILSGAQQIFRKLGTELLAPSEVNEADAMTDLCLRLNRVIMEAAGGVHSCPAFAGCYNEDLGTVCYVNAGHTPGLVRDNSGTSELAATGLPLGLFSHTTCEAPIMALEPGADLLLVSRGVVEAECEGDEFSLKSVENVLEKTAGRTADAICAAVIQAVQEFSCRRPARNDLTALALVRAIR